MDFFLISNVVSNVLLLLTSLILIHHVFFGIVGLFARKKFPETDEKLKYGIIIPARDEETVVGNLIESIQTSNYPQDKLHVFVIAHNCTDRTAEICRSMGATVYEYNNPEECTMGYAFRYLFDRIKEDHGIENYDGFFLFNADNVVDEMFFSKMNDAFVAEGKKSVITSYRNSKNFGNNAISACYGLYFIGGSVLESRGRTVVGCSTRVQGTGYVINSDIVKDGWNYVSLTEDWEFTADRIMNDTKIMYCDDAIFYDEQPTLLRVTLRQRLRWQKGHLLVCLTRLKDLVKALFRPRKKGGIKHKFSLYDITAYILPLAIISVCVSLISFGVSFLNPAIYESDLAFSDFLNRTAVSLGISFGTAYLSSFIVGVILYIKERKRIKSVSLPLKILSAVLYPFFMALSIPLEFVALFKRNVGWKTIPHNDRTKSSDLAAADGKKRVTAKKHTEEKKKVLAKGTEN
ncbi:MAG: glycosyltransferase family 2 protein [Clostridia bacterium]|nr:glycosyltransferase family 2 protein [Clostridia bacterium]